MSSLSMLRPQTRCNLFSSAVLSWQGVVNSTQGGPATDRQHRRVTCRVTPCERLTTTTKRFWRKGTPPLHCTSSSLTCTASQKKGPASALRLRIGNSTASIRVVKKKSLPACLTIYLSRWKQFHFQSPCRCPCHCCCKQTPLHPTQWCVGGWPRRRQAALLFSQCKKQPQKTRTHTHTTRTNNNKNYIEKKRAEKKSKKSPLWMFTVVASSLRVFRAQNPHPGVGGSGHVVRGRGQGGRVHAGRHARVGRGSRQFVCARGRGCCARHGRYCVALRCVHFPSAACCPPPD